MKNIIRNLALVGLFSMALIFNSCQDEFEDVNIVNDEETITASSNTANLIANTSSNDGSFDNIVDGASCFAINFPYTVEVAGIQITIDSREDLQLIEEIFDELDTDEDILDIIFPITITLADFTEITIENTEALRELVAECTEGDDDDIECIDFVYPITLFTFDTNQETRGQVVVNSDRELRRFFAGLEDDDIVSIDFPITLISFDGTEIMVNSNAELALALERARNECDEDDDNDFNDDDFTKERLDAFLVECPWEVRSVIRNAFDTTSDFFEDILVFSEDGTVVLNASSTIRFNGTWTTIDSDRGVILTLEFEELPDFNFQWVVYEIAEGKIRLFGGEDDKVVLKQSCESDGNSSTDCDRAVVAEYLESGCLWQIADTDLEIDFEGTIDFSNRNIHAFLNNGTFADEGNWEVTDDGFRFNALLARIAALAGEWTIAECGETRIKLVNADGRFVVLEKNCDIEVPTLETLREILMECEWIIRLVKNQGEQINRVLGYKFEFMADGVVTLSNGINPSQGTWEVGFNDEMQLALLITLGAEGSVSFNWPLRDLTNERLSFEVEDIGYELVLQRVCDDNAGDGDVLEIRNIMLGGQWNVALYTEGDVDLTSNYTDFDFSFSNMNQVEISQNDDPIALGLWRVIRNADEALKFYLNFSDPGNNFAPLTGVWYIEEVDASRIRLVYEDENTVNVLVFEKRV